MGNEYIQEDVQIFYSLFPQAAINVPEEDGSRFVCALVDAFPAILPAGETVDDLNQVGDGSEFPRFVRLYRWTLSFGLGARANTELCAVLIARALGGDITDSVLAAGQSWDHQVIMQKRVQKRIPKATTMILPGTGGSDFIFADVFVDGFTIAQQGDAQPTAQFQLMGTGLHNRLANRSALLAALPDPVTQTPQHNYFHGAALQFGLNDGSVKDIVGSGRFMDYSFEYKNNIKISRRAGDGFIGTDPGSNQVETATAAGTISAPGNVTAIVTAAGMSNSPKTVNVAVLAADAPAVTAGKIRAALLADPDVGAYFYVGGVSTKIMLIKKTKAANDATANIALATGTATGLTAAPTSVNSVAGIVPAGTNNVKTGAYGRNVIHGKRTAMLNFTDTLGDVLDEYDWLRNNTLLTSVGIVNMGDIIESTRQFQLGLTIPAGQLQTAAGGQNDNFLTVQDGILALKDTVTEGLVIANIRNNQATLI